VENDVVAILAEELLESVEKVMVGWLDENYH